MFRVSSSRFNNYPAYEFNLEPLDFYQVNNEDLYIGLLRRWKRR